MHYDYKTENTCAQMISFDIDGDVITNISFLGGCNGNLKAIAKLVDGWTADRIEEMLMGEHLRKTPYFLRRPVGKSRPDGSCNVRRIVLN